MSNVNLTLLPNIYLIIIIIIIILIITIMKVSTT